MKLRTFIDRPILACVISVLILMLGLISLFNLPMEQYPDIAPPTVMVSTSYTGANAETVQKSVIVPLEEAINGVENMTYMTSTSTNNGSGSITVYFKQGTDPDMATINTKNRVSEAEGLLPAEVTKVGVTVEKRQNSTLKILTLYSPDNSYDQTFINNYFKINIEPRLSRITGVGNVNVMGGDYAMRIWLNPQVMAQYSLVPDDVISALGDQNVEAATGTLGEDSENTYQYTLKYRGRYETSEEFGNIVIKSLANGEVLRLKDIAKVELGAQSYAYNSEINGHPGATCMISQTAGSNANEIIQEIDKLTEEISKELPKGLVLSDLMSTKDFLDASIHEVVKTLIEAILLVILVVYVFLQSVRSTIIPAVSIIVSLIGTFAFLYLAGFSLNLLTLFALVLVIGTVVDDAIVVVEAVQAKFDEGERSPYKATTGAMDGIAAAIVTTSLVFMAVFIPSSFMGGTSGTFYMQFGLTMAVAVGISAINALTLSPALCALIMTPHIDTTTGQKLSFSTRFHHAFEASFNRLILRYKNGVKWFFRRKWVVGTALVASMALLAVLMKTTKTGLVPDEDMGCIFMNVTTPPGSSLSQTIKAMSEVENSIKDIPQIMSYSNVSGYSMMGGQAPSGGMLIIRLKPWEERPEKKDEINAVIAEIYKRTANIKSAKLFVFAQPTIMGYGMGSGFELYVQDRAGGDINTLQKYTTDFIAALNQRPEIQMAYTSFDTKFPQYTVEVDAARCQRAGITTTDVLSVLSGFIGGNYSSNLNRFSKLYRVMVQADKVYRLDKDALNNMFVRTSSGEMAPIGQFVTLTKVYGTETLTRFNLYNSIQVNGLPADGYSTGEAIAAIEEVAKQTLPVGYGYEFGGITREEAGSGSNTIIIFAICIIFVFLILCALYESIFVPLAVMLSVPFGLMGSFLFAKMWGLENNIYMQTGLIMLIGLLAKTAILLTEYASARRRQGMTIAQAAVSAAGVRLRPILMTALTMIIGLLPLVFASGAGANGNISLGVGTVGGMIVGTLALLFVVPTLFIVFQTLQEKLMPTRKRDED
ncbi:efflux RND transporter permease subunit [Phocaeicola coprophilus]|jgi:hydrophobe/amphiphile efflux-1 (HAE1) family protein|uniref:RND transporter, HAE1 family n=3 Tax=Phocaeicola coprophilus TaxID=387090 RepID=S0FD38_9BACT|nr:efflux RND transporter permease subunit [Phocaeicola coprophilus]EEF78040.1 RND transporter, HAE1 family [Phocaeicola coprophilus DSM 18228 = JCM 13818]QRO23724.1 efflux RND transporter permease subunit [Phocaeicola coprophilus]RHA77507.1 hydrophobe/amphiphile efflux-1 family RND transporter [Phocaeicola coprophilus]HJE48078.1 efflux RND transporter permease subunit [Phocaeicola coprophilus]